MTVDFETKCEQTALDYIKIHLREGYLVTVYKGVGNYYWESVYKIRASLSTNRKTENSSEKPNNCEHITEDGVTCARYPACDDCPDNPLNKAKGSERLVKGSDEPQTDCAWGKTE